ncbi:MAG TPA: SurA N-terminal domain-containing protein [Allosphingosinicella sp.]|nr:SurA N-terminal domain-containing protein [Allosphingosinicella sp.]
MLRTFRSKLSSWLMLGFLGVAVAAIVITGFGTGGVGGLPTGGSSGDETLVEVAGEEVQAAELERLIRRQLEAARQQNPELDIGQFITAGAYDGILNQMVVARALAAFGRANGLVVSDRMIDRVIANLPEFRSFTGQFDENTYRSVLQRQNMSEQQLRDEIGNFLMQRQLQTPIGLAARMPESVAVQYASLMLERRRGTIGVVPIEAVSQGIAPSPQEVAAFYQQNRTRYTIPERRVLRYALIGSEQVAAQATPTDAEIQAYYRQNGARYAGAETRALQQVVLPNQAEARSFAERVRGGANFEQAAGQNLIALERETSEGYGRVSSPQLAQAVFSAAQNGVVGPMSADGRWYVVRVVGITRASGRSLEAVRSEIVTALEQRKREDALAELVTRIEERTQDGASFEEIVRQERLAMVETPPVTAAGQAPGAQWQAPADLQPLLRGAFEIDPEDPVPVVETITPNQRLAFVSVARVLPAAVPPLQQIADRVRADVVRQRANDRARQIAARIVDRINSGAPSARAFAEAGVRLPAPQPVNARRIEIAQRGQQVPPPLAMLFAIPQGRARLLQAPNGAGWFVVHLEQRTAGQASCPQGQNQQQQQANEGCRLIQAARQEFGGQAGSEYTEQFARAAQQGTEVTRDDQAIAATRQRLLAGSAAAE